jgi:hypothetical protein
VCTETAHVIEKCAKNQANGCYYNSDSTDVITSNNDQDNLTRMTEGSAGPTSVLPIRNITTGKVQFLNTATNASKIQNIQEYLNVFLMADIEVTRLQEPISEDNISGDKMEQHGEESFMFEATNSPTNRMICYKINFSTLYLLSFQNPKKRLN